MDQLDLNQLIRFAGACRGRPLASKRGSEITVSGQRASPRISRMAARSKKRRDEPRRRRGLRSQCVDARFVHKTEDEASTMTLRSHFMAALDELNDSSRKSRRAIGRGQVSDVFLGDGDVVFQVHARKYRPLRPRRESPQSLSLPAAHHRGRDVRGMMRVTGSGSGHRVTAPDRADDEQTGRDPRPGVSLRRTDDRGEPLTAPVSPEPR